MTSSSTPFWTSVFRAARIGSPSLSKKGRRKIDSPSSASPGGSPTTASPKGSPNVDSKMTFTKSSPVEIPSKFKALTINEYFAPGDANSSAATVVESTSSQLLCVHPAVSKLGSELEADLSSIKDSKRAGSLGSAETTGSSTLSSAAFRRSSLYGSRSVSISGPSGRRRVSFAPNPAALVVQYDAHQPAIKCLDKRISEQINEEVEPPEEEGVDLSSVSSSAIAPAADDEWLQSQRQEEEDAKVAARIREKQMKALKKARQLAQHRQQAQQQRARRTSWGNALSASVLSMGGGLGGAVL